MNYIDKTLIHLAAPTTRAGPFDEVALEQLIASAYDTEAISVEGPYQPLFNDFRLGYPVSQLGIVEGTWRPVGAVEKVEANSIYRALAMRL